MNKYHEVEDIEFSKKKLCLTIDGERKEFDIHEISPRLFHANTIQRSTYKISPSGYGIHWPLIDEDLSIDGLLKFSKQQKISA